MKDQVWITRDGQRLLVSQMTTSHINNAIAMIQRSNRGWRRSYLKRLELELRIRRIRRVM